MKNLILAMALVITVLTGCDKNETDEFKKEQISTAHYNALGVLQSLPGYQGTWETGTNEKGSYLSTGIRLSEEEWKPGEESVLSNEVAVLMLKSGELNFKGWIHESNSFSTGTFVYKNVNENKSTIVITFLLDPISNTFDVLTNIR